MEEGKWADDGEVNRRFEKFFQPSTGEFKNELHYDVKIWLDEREAEEALKKPFDLMIAFALICTVEVVDILLLSRDLESLVALGRVSLSQRLRVCFGLYGLCAVHQRLRNLPDNEWKRWPVRKKSHCFHINELSTLSALDIFCTKVETSSFEWIFKWVRSVIRRPGCDPLLYLIKNVIIEAGVLNFIEWSRKFRAF